MKMFAYSHGTIDKSNGSDDWGWMQVCFPVDGIENMFQWNE